MFSLQVSQASNLEISDFADRIIEAIGGKTKIQVELDGVPWMFLKSGAVSYYFTKGDDKHYQNIRSEYDAAVVNSGNIALYDDLFVHLRDNDGTALVTADRVFQLLRNYRSTIKNFGINANPKKLLDVVLMDELQELIQEQYREVEHLSLMALSHHGFEQIRDKFLRDNAQSKLTAYGEVMTMMHITMDEKGVNSIDRKEFEALFTEYGK